MKTGQNNFLYLTLLSIIALFMTSCEKSDVEFDKYLFLKSNGFFIMNEGSFMAGNGSVSYFSYDSMKVYNNLFYNINGVPLGDIVFSATASEKSISIVVNNSDKIVFASKNDLKSEGTISKLISPRYIRNINESKAYVTSLFSDSLIVVDTKNKSISGYIDLGKSSEFMAISGSYLYISHWSGGSSITILNTGNDSVVETVQLTNEPGNIVVDHQGYIWVLCNGGWQNEEYPVLYKLIPESGEISSEFQFSKLTDSPAELCIDSAGENLYFLNRDIFKMATDAQQLPQTPLIEAEGMNFYGMDLDPKNGNILVSDAIDYMQNGDVYIFSALGEQIISFKAGIIPSSFCFKD